MKPIIGAFLFGLILFGFIKLGKHIGKARDPKRKQHDHNLNPQGFDDGWENDNHMHV